MISDNICVKAHVLAALTQEKRRTCSFHNLNKSLTDLFLLCRQYVDGRPQLLGVMFCFVAKGILLQISCIALGIFSLEPLSNNLDTPWLISFYGNSMKPENG